MKSTVKLAALLCGLILGGCTSTAPVSDAELEQTQANIDQMLAENTPTNYVQQIANRLHRELKDPYSVRDAEISAPGIGFVGLFNGGHGVVVCARFNAKNSFGGYTGSKVHGFMFKHKVIAIEWPEDVEPLACRGRSYHPFQELTAAK